MDAKLPALVSRLRLVNELAQRLSRARTQAEVLGVFRQQLRWILDHHEIIIARTVPEAGQGAFRLIEASGVAVPLVEPDKTATLQGGLLGEALTRRTPLLIGRLSAEMLQADPLADLLWQMRAAIVTPLAVRGEPALLLGLWSRREDAYTQEDLKLLFLLGNLLASALANLDLFSALQQAYRRLDREFEVVGEIQRALLPDRLPQIEGFQFACHYETSTRAGGDYYDFFPLPGDRLGILVADVSGHGPPAAVVMAMLRVILHTWPGPLDPPGDVLARANRLLATQVLSGTFVTAFYGVLDPTRHRLDYASAGHYPPLHLTDGDVRRAPQAPGLPLGALDETDFEQRQISLRPGDRLTLFTDGLIEQLSPQRELFGEARLVEAIRQAGPVSAPALRDALLEAMREFAAGQSPDDDLTILTLAVL